MPNLTLSVPEELYRRMKTHPYVKWTEVARRAIAEHLETVEQQTDKTFKTAQLRKMLEEKGLDIRTIPLKRATRHSERMRELEWKRTKTIYSTQTS